MRNNYETAEVLELGRINDQILGSKPPVGEVDALQGFPWQIMPEPDDIDESDD